MPDPRSVLRPDMRFQVRPAPGRQVGAELPTTTTTPRQTPPRPRRCPPPRACQRLQRPRQRRRARPPLTPRERDNPPLNRKAPASLFMGSEKLGLAGGVARRRRRVVFPVRGGRLPVAGHPGPWSRPTGLLAGAGRGSAARPCRRHDSSCRPSDANGGPCTVTVAPRRARPGWSRKIGLWARHHPARGWPPPSWLLALATAASGVDLVVRRATGGTFVHAERGSDVERHWRKGLVVGRRQSQAGEPGVRSTKRSRASRLLGRIKVVAVTGSGRAVERTVGWRRSLRGSAGDRGLPRGRSLFGAHEAER